MFIGKPSFFLDLAGDVQAPSDHINNFALRQEIKKGRQVKRGLSVERQQKKRPVFFNKIPDVRAALQLSESGKNLLLCFLRPDAAQIIRPEISLAQQYHVIGQFVKMGGKHLFSRFFINHFQLNHHGQGIRKPGLIGMFNIAMRCQQISQSCFAGPRHTGHNGGPKFQIEFPGRERIFCHNCSLRASRFTNGTRSCLFLPSACAPPSASQICRRSSFALSSRSAARKAVSSGSS